MTAAADERALTRLYDSLARLQWWRRRLTGASAGEQLEMHKQLQAPTGDGPGAGGAALNEWLWRRLAPFPAMRVLDVGCGFGATLLDWASRAAGGTFVGLSLSEYQVRKAREEARRRGMDDRCHFHAQSFDDPIEGRYDRVVSIESLFHAPDLPRVLSHLASGIDDGGVLVLVEDMATSDGIGAEPDGRELLRCWCTRRLHTAREYRRHLATAGLEIEEEVDLTAQVPRRPPAVLERQRRRLAAMYRVFPVPGLRRVLDAFRGGLALERLYGGDRMEYRAMIAVRRKGRA